MPYYDLTCSACGHTYNTKASIAEKESGSILCPACGADKPLTRYGRRNSLSSSGREKAPACPNAHVCGGCCNH